MQVLEAFHKKALRSECFHKGRHIRSCWARLELFILFFILFYKIRHTLE